MDAYTFRFVTPEEKERGETCQHPAHQLMGEVPATIARESDDHWAWDEYFCDDHAQELAEAQGRALAAIYPDAILRHYRFYLEYGGRTHDASENGKDGWELAKLHKGRASREKLFVRRICHSQGNLVAIWIDDNGQPQRDYTGMTGYETVLFSPNSPVNGGDLPHEYLATCCERISREQALMVGHTQLFNRIREDDAREQDFAARQD